MKYNMSYLVLGISILAIGVLGAVPKMDVGSQINAAAYMGSNKTALMSADTNLDECIAALDSGNTTSASEHCKMADQALESFIGKHKSSSSGNSTRKW